MDDLSTYKVHVVWPKEQVTVLVTGDGTFGTVNQILYNGAPCVAKGIRNHMVGNRCEAVVPMTKDLLTSPSDNFVFDNFVKECGLNSKLRHPNIIQFIGVVYGNEPNNHDLLLIMERMDTNLDSCLEAHPNIPLSIKLSVLRDVSAGLMYLHSQAKIIHGDLTTTNILLTQDWRAKIADFGNSVDQSTLAIAPGALAYMPPEAFTRPQKDDSKLDIFSLGTVALYVGIQTRDADRNKRSDQLQTLKTAPDGGECLYQIVTWCCDDDPNKRPSSCDINNHLQALCVKFPASCRQLMELYQVIESWKKDKDLADIKVLEVQRELEDIKKTRSDEINRLKIEVEDLKSKADLERVQEASQKRLDDDAKISELEKELRAAPDVLSSFEIFTKELRSLSKTQKERAEILDYQCNTFKDDFKQERQDRERAMDRVESLERKVEAQREENAMLTTRIEDLVHELEAAKQTIDRQEGELEAAKEEISVKVAKVKQNQKQVEANKQRCNTFRDDFGQERQDRERAMVERVESLERKVEAQREENAMLTTRIEDLVHELEAAKQTIDRQGGELEAAKEEIAVKVAQVKQYQKQVEAYKQQGN